MTKPHSPPSRAAAVASFWCVHLRTAQYWLANPARTTAPLTPPLAALDEPSAMLAWVRSLPATSQAKLTRTFRARCDAFRIALERGQPLPLPVSRSSPSSGSSPSPASPASPASSPTDPDWLAFQRDHQAALAAPGATPLTGVDLASLRLRCAYADYKIGLAQQRGDHASVREWTETLRYIAGVIHDEELRAQRLNREIGDTLPRAEAARLIRALPYWLLRGIDSLHAALDRPLAAAASSGPVLPETIRTLLEPHALAALLHAPLVRATQVTSPNALPRWALDEFRAAHAATLEDGAALFDQLYATPPPAPPVPADPAKPLGNAITGHAQVAASAPASVGSETAPSAHAISSATTDVGSVPAQTALKENNHDD